MIYDESVHPHLIVVIQLEWTLRHSDRKDLKGLTTVKPYSIQLKMDCLV